MSVRSLGAAGALTLMLTACSGGLSVTNDWDPNVDFATYQTFAVMDPAAGGEQLNQLIIQRVKNAITSTLTAKGMRQVSNVDEAEAAVGWQITTDERSSFSTVSTGWGGYGRGWGYGGWYGGYGGMGMMGTSTTTETRYTVGALVIAIFDVQREEMIFTATGSKELSTDNPSPDEAQTRANDIVQQILASFPPGAGDQPDS